MIIGTLITIAVLQQQPTKTVCVRSVGPSTTATATPRNQPVAGARGRAIAASEPQEAESYGPFEIVFPPGTDPAKVRNRILLEGEVGDDGRLRHVKVLRSCGISAVDQQVLDGVQKWRFRPRQKSAYLTLAVIVEII